MRKNRMRGTRAISPIFAVLILIAIAVMGGVVVYLFTSGYLSGMTGGGGVGQEKVGIQAIQAYGANGTVIAHCKSIAGSDVVISDAILKSAAGVTLQVLDITDVTLVAAGTMNIVDCDFDAANIVTGNTYTVTLVSSEGNQFVSGAFTAQ
jgi:flagellin-like protein